MSSGLPSPHTGDASNASTMPSTAPHGSSFSVPVTLVNTHGPDATMSLCNTALASVTTATARVSAEEWASRLSSATEYAKSSLYGNEFLLEWVWNYGELEKYLCVEKGDTVMGPRYISRYRCVQMIAFLGLCPEQEFSCKAQGQWYSMAKWSRTKAREPTFRQFGRTLALLVLEVQGFYTRRLGLEYDPTRAGRNRGMRSRVTGMLRKNQRKTYWNTSIGYTTQRNLRHMKPMFMQKSLRLSNDGHRSQRCDRTSRTRPPPTPSQRSKPCRTTLQWNCYQLSTRTSQGTLQQRRWILILVLRGDLHVPPVSPADEPDVIHQIAHTLVWFNDPKAQDA